MYSIYMHRNKINKKVYIGITKQTPEVRWGKNGSKYKRHKHFWNSIQMYGWDNFEHLILTKVSSQKEAEKLEKLLIKRYKATNRQYGYNVRNFGMVKTPYVVYQYNIYNGNIIKVWKDCMDVEEALGIKASAIRLNCSKKKATCFGSYFTYNNYGYKLPVDVLKNIQNKSFKNVAQYDLYGNYINEYMSVEDATKSLGTGRPFIGRGVSYGFIWKEISIFNENKDYKNKLTIYELRKYLKNYTGKLKCCQYDLSGKFIKTFKNAKEAATQVKLNYLTILKVCEMKSNYAGGYIWRFANEFTPDKDLPYDDSAVLACKETNTTIFQYNLNGIFLNSFKNSTDAGKKTGISRNTIKMSAYKKYIKGESYLWRYEKDGYEKYKNLLPEEICVMKSNSKPVSKYSIEGNFIETYDSAASAAKEINKRRECIRDCCNGRQKTAYGFVWRFATQKEIEEFLKTKYQV